MDDEAESLKLCFQAGSHASWHHGFGHVLVVDALGLLGFPEFRLACVSVGGGLVMNL